MIDRSRNFLTDHLMERRSYRVLVSRAQRGVLGSENQFLRELQKIFEQALFQLYPKKGAAEVKKFYEKEWLDISRYLLQLYRADDFKKMLDWKSL